MRKNKYINSNYYFKFGKRYKNWLEKKSSRVKKIKNIITEEDVVFRNIKKGI